MAEAEGSVDVDHFARVYVDDPGQIPPQSRAAKNERGYYYRLELDDLGVDDASSLLQKAAEEFATEVVGQVKENGRVTKERRYVSSPAEVPDGYVPQRGPEGGVFYETNPANNPTDQVSPHAATEDVGYDGEPVLAVQFEDVEEGDRVAFEREDGTRDMGRAVNIDEDDFRVSVESGDGETVVEAATFETPAEKAEGSGGDGGGGTLTSGTPGAHNARYSREEDEDDEPDITPAGGSVSKADVFEADVFRVVAPDDADLDYEDDLIGIGVDFPNHDVYVDWRNSVFPDELDNAHVSIYGSVADLEQATGNDTEVIGTVDPDDDSLSKMAVGVVERVAKDTGEEPWVYYVGPRGGEGWQNMVTGEIRYQQQRPGPAPEEGDGYGDWLAEGWAEPSGDPNDLHPGQTVEIQEGSLFGDGDYFAAEVVTVGDGGVTVQTEDGTEDTFDYENVTAVEEYDPLDEWAEDVEQFDSADEYWESVYTDEIPEHASEQAQAVLEAGEVETEFDSHDTVEPVEFSYYIDEDESSYFASSGPAVAYEDLPEFIQEDAPPEEAGPGMQLPEPAIEDMVVDERMPWNGDEEAEGEAEGSDDGVADVEFVEATPENFAEGVEGFIEDNPEMGAYLTEHPPEDLEDHQLFMSADGGAGAAVSPEGDIQNVYNHTGPDGAGEAALVKAIEEGGRTLDCYDGFLPGLYKQHGFVETARQEFNPEYAPDALEYDESDPPDVVFMHYDPDGSDAATDTYINDWGEAKERSRDLAVEQHGGEEAGDPGPSGGGEGRGVGGEEPGAHSEPGPADGQAVDHPGDDNPAEEAVGQAVSEPEPADGSDTDANWASYTADYDMAEYTPDAVDEWGSLSEFGFPSGVHQDMRVGALDSWDGESNEGLIFENNYGPGAEDPEIGHRQMVTYTLGDALGGNMPTHVGHPEEDGWVAAEGVEGENIGSAPAEYREQVDPEDFYEQAGIQLLLGNNDAHHQNMMVTPDGQIVVHDIDHSAGDITGDFTGNKPQYDDALDRTLGELWRSAQYVVDDDEETAKQRMLEAAKQTATEAVKDPESSYPDPEQAVFEALDHSNTTYDPDLTSNVWNNITALVTDEISWN